MEVIRPDQGNCESEQNYYLSGLLDDMQNYLCWYSPKTDLGLWVFSSYQQSVSPCISESDPNDLTNHSVIQDRIKAALSTIQALGNNDSMMVQFWTPTMSGGRCVLKTSRQPFALRSPNDKLTQYRKYCQSFEFSAHANGEGKENLSDGLPARVFQNQLPEYCPDVDYYSIKEYPQRDLALSCGITQIVALPVFGLSRPCCVGVLELVCTGYTSLLMKHLVDEANHALEEADLKFINMSQIRKQIQVSLGHVEQEITGALYLVHKVHGLSISFAWARCAHSIVASDCDSSAVRYNDLRKSYRGDLVVSVPGMWYSQSLMSYDYYEASRFIPLRVGQGLVGKAFLSHKPCLCKDVTQLSISEYPMVHFARYSGFTGCFAVFLQSTTPRNHDYVLEFFLPRSETYSGDLQFLLSSVLATMKQHFQSFEVATEDLGNELFSEVDSFSIDGGFKSIKTCPTLTSQPSFNALQNKEDLLQPDRGEVLVPENSDHQLVIEDFANNRSDSAGTQQCKTATLDKIWTGEEMKAAKRKESSCSYQILKKQFGKKLEDAAQSLGVSRSTVKRWCRDNNISRWPFPKRNKVSSLSFDPKQIVEFRSGNVQQTSEFSSVYPSCSTTKHSAPAQAPDTVTIKATYRADIIKFQLSYSAKMIDLVAKVTHRLNLRDGTFRIKYLDDDGDYILIACDEDLQDCMNSLRVSEKTTVKILIEQITTYSP